MSKNICITGVSGFLGRCVAEECLRRGYNPTGVDQNKSSIKGLNFVRADIRDKERMTKVMKGQDYVVHLAAVTSNLEFIKNPAHCYDINANGFLTVIETAARGGCKRFIYASSAAVYLDGFSEETVIDFRKVDNHYAKTKIMNEMAATSYANIYKMKTTGLRYFNVYGSGENHKGDYASIITLLLNAKNNAQPLVIYGNGTQARDLIHVVDAARITLDLLENGSHDVYNVGTGVATAYVVIADLIDRHNVTYIPNPLSSYQHYTRADTARLRGVVGDYKFIDVETGLKSLSSSSAVTGLRSTTP